MKATPSRRNFLKKSIASTLGIITLGSSACTINTSEHRKSKIGLILYTVRDAMSEDVAGTLKKVADLGYKELELADYNNGKFYGYAPNVFKKLVEDLGLKIISSHTQVEARGITLENAQKMADDHADLGVKYCVQPWVEEKDRSIDSYKKMVGDWNKVGEIMKKTGIQFAYHNHNFEFENLDGIIPYYDIILAELDPELVTMELDLFWATKAGQDPLKMFTRYPGRFQLLHVKDMYINEQPFFDLRKEDMAPVGKGVIDFKSILSAKELSGMKHFFVEDDNQGNGKPFEMLETSIDNLKKKILI